jgi:hypothetical protein
VVSRAEAEIAVRGVAIAWAAAALIDLAQDAVNRSTDYFLHFWIGAVAIAALAAIVSRGSPRWIGWLFLAQIGRLMAELPDVNNHWILAGAADAIVLVAALGAGRARPAEILERAVPALRGLVICLYAIAAFHKLNRGFFDPSTSCAGALLAQLSFGGRLALGSVTITRLAIVAAWLSEAAIGALLAFRPTRKLGLLWALLFHGALGLAGSYFGFSATVIALLLVFLEPADRERVFAAIRARPAALALAIGVALAAIAIAVRAAGLPVGRGFYFHLGWAGACGVCGWGLLAALRDGPLAAPALGPVSVAAWAVPILFVANGLAPYTGLKTENSFSMYSNLTTERGESNHWLMPNLNWFPYQNDLVALESPSDPYLSHLAEYHWLVNRASLESYLAKADPALRVRVRAEDGSEAVVSAADARRASLARRWWRKIFAFRPVPESGQRICQH